MVVLWLRWITGEAVLPLLDCVRIRFLLAALLAIDLATIAGDRHAVLKFLAYQWERS